eukprot:jgi/Galph1/1756/GphlegSOOS_G450.1
MYPPYYQGGRGTGFGNQGFGPNAFSSYPYYSGAVGGSPYPPFGGAQYGAYPPSYGMQPQNYGYYPPMQPPYGMPRREERVSTALPALTFEPNKESDSKKSKEHGIKKYLQLTSEEERLFASLFREASGGSGTVLGRDAVQFFGRAVDVDRATLKKIWDIADYRNAGELRRDEFYLALRLVAIAQLGYEVSKKTLKEFIGKELFPEFKGTNMGGQFPMAPAASNRTPPGGNAHPGYPPYHQMPQVPQMPSQTQSVWELKPQECKKYDHQFAELDKTKKGFVAGTRTAEKLAESGLPRPILKRIWELADVTCDGKLDYIEFRIAMTLVNGAKQGHPLPQTLPPSLHPEKLKKTPFARKTGKSSAATNDASLSRSYNPSSSAIYASSGSGAATWQENPSELVAKVREADNELERVKLEMSEVEKEYRQLEDETQRLRQQIDSKKWEIDYLKNSMQTKPKGASQQKSPPLPPSSASIPNSSDSFVGRLDIFSAPVNISTPSYANYPNVVPVEDDASKWNAMLSLPPPVSNAATAGYTATAWNDTDDFLDRPYVPEGGWTASQAPQNKSSTINDWNQYYLDATLDNTVRPRGISASKKHE